MDNDLIEALKEYAIEEFGAAQATCEYVLYKKEDESGSQEFRLEGPTITPIDLLVEEETRNSKYTIWVFDTETNNDSWNFYGAIAITKDCGNIIITGAPDTNW